jgi:hypothetical protein
MTSKSKFEFAVLSLPVPYHACSLRLVLQYFPDGDNEFIKRARCVSASIGAQDTSGTSFVRHASVEAHIGTGPGFRQDDISDNNTHELRRFERI